MDVDLNYMRGKCEGVLNMKVICMLFRRSGPKQLKLNSSFKTVVRRFKLDLNPQPFG